MQYLFVKIFVDNPPFDDRVRVSGYYLLSG
jgi:hypothetical protein